MDSVGMSALYAQMERRDTLPASVVTGVRRLQFDAGEILSTPESVRAAASPLGEGDPIRWIQYLPGVSTGADGTSASFVRGGNMGGNLISLDGVPVYGYSHVLGLTTVVPNDALESVSFAKGGFGGNQTFPLRISPFRRSSPRKTGIIRRCSSIIF